VGARVPQQDRRDRRCERRDRDDRHVERAVAAREIVRIAWPSVTTASAVTALATMSASGCRQRCASASSAPPSATSNATQPYCHHGDGNQREAAHAAVCVARGRDEARADLGESPSNQ